MYERTLIMFSKIMRQPTIEVILKIRNHEQ
jgi:hypothetical protein